MPTLSQFCLFRAQAIRFERHMIFALKVAFSQKTFFQIIIADGRPFTFDHIFTHEHNQEAVYAQLIKPLVGKLLEGYNATALAYGQTGKSAHHSNQCFSSILTVFFFLGTGKTYTMGLHVENSDDHNAGMLLRTMQDVFVKLSEMPNQIEQEIFISFIEIYNEKAYDLITNSMEPINVRGQKFVGGSKERVMNVEQARHIVMEGNKNRHVRPTKMNVSSSRSHAVFTVYASIKRGALHTNSSLHIVDLAGSEGIRRTGHQGLALTEGVNINQGLLSIGKVLQALSTGAKVIPYRDSFLTTVLQSSLNANAYLTLLACISPMAVDISETLNTLRFALNAKTYKNNPQINSITAECLRTIAAKTPSKTLVGQPLRAKNSFATPSAKRTYSKAHESTISSLSTIKKPVHSNTFCTPSKLRKVDLFKHNATDLGYLSAGKKRMTAMPDLPRNHVVDMDDLAELQYFNQDLPSVVRDSIDSRASILSLNVSNSTSIDVAPVPLSYSPLVKRCMAEFEATIDDKLKKMFENLQNVTMGVRMTEETPLPAVLEQRQPENPTWDTMKMELQSIVRAELTTIMSANTVSEPVFAFKRPQSLPLTSTVRKEQPFVKRTNNDRTLAPRHTMNMSCLAEESVLERTASNHTKIVYDGAPPAPVMVRRQSVRLSKQITRNVEPVDRRRSCRISAKAAVKENVAPEPKSLAVKKSGRVAQLKNKVIAGYFHSNESMEQKGVGRVSKKAHKEAVLKLLNSGSIKELQILPTIGLKTAYQLITHRTLKGKFKGFDEISKLPVWRVNGWQRFERENNLV
jgi:DNA uptake protein ComE-like DNA-binding protein